MSPAVLFVNEEKLPIRRQIYRASLCASGANPAAMAFGPDAFLDHCCAALRAEPEQDVRIEVVLKDAEDYALVRHAWPALRAFAGRRSLTLRIRVGHAAPTRQPKLLVIDVDDHGPIALQNKLAAVAKLAAGADGVVMMTAQAPLSWPRTAALLLLSTDTGNVLFDTLGDIELDSTSQIAFLRNTRPNLHLRVARDFWKQIYANAIPEVSEIDDALRIKPLRLFETKPPTTLFVFPERMLPLQRAYFLRAFDLLLGLNYSGECTAALALGPNNPDLAKIQGALEVICPQVRTSPLSRGQYSSKQKIVRVWESLRRRRAGIDTPPPIRFSERCSLFATAGQTQLVGAALDAIPTLRNVVYTGAWFTPALAAIRSRHPSLKFFCDTHDVFFVLDADSNAHERRFFYDAQKERQHELALLSRADAVLAISEADRASLVAAGCASPVIVESGSFSHASRGVDVRDGPTDPVFGFIGSNNTNNAKCLEIVRLAWWPAIVARHPQARLSIAGAICKAPVAKMLADQFPDSVNLLGFVALVSDFYRSVQAMLSPIAVQGGLNFKSVEALMAGRLLVTNALGSRCLGSGLEGVRIVAEDGEGLDSVLAELQRVPELPDQRLRIHRHAASRFGDECAYATLIRTLREPPQHVGPRGARTHAALGQALPAAADVLQC